MRGSDVKRHRVGGASESVVKSVGRQCNDMMTSSPLLLLVATWFLSCLLHSTIVAAEVTVVGSTYATTRLYATASISVPAEARSGDLLVIFIGGSGRQDLEPSGPLPSSGWKEIIRFGPKDINQKAYYKIYREGRERDPFGNSWRSTYGIKSGEEYICNDAGTAGWFKNSTNS